MKTAFITGIAGQDGSYLAEHLLAQGYRVTGIIRRNSTVEHQKDRIGDLPVDVEYGDLTDQSSLERALRMFKPDEIYNLGAQSHVRISSDIPQFTAQVNALGVINMLEAYRTVVPNAKFYQASSSEMFGSSVDADQYQRETTPMRPVSPYGCTKVFAYNMVHHYRKAYKLHASNGILFNHESPRRGSNFVTNKVVKGAVEIALGLSKQLEMGNMDSYRDWGHSYDYVRAMHLIVQQDQPDDFVVSTGITRSVRDMCEYVFGRLNLDYKQYVTQNPKYLRPEELPYLRGDNTKIVTQLGWKPTYSFEALMDEMIAHWQEIYSHKVNNTI
jgi:GDPmannose 4,6-dehydratase